MLIKCYGGPCDGQVIESAQENNDCRLPSNVPMPHKVDDEYRVVNYILVVEERDGWANLRYELDTDDSVVD